MRGIFSLVTIFALILPFIASASPGQIIPSRCIPIGGNPYSQYINVSQDGQVFLTGEGEKVLHLTFRGARVVEYYNGNPPALTPGLPVGNLYFIDGRASACELTDLQ
jgi:hypothetical protein